MKLHTYLTQLALAAATLFVTSCSGTSSTAGVKPYPSSDCIVTDNKLGSMGDPITKVYQGQEVKFCCKACVPKFDKDPAKYMAKL